MLDLRRAFNWLSSASLVGRGDERVSAVGTDTRAIEPGSLFVALRGERFDAHDFIDQACRAGAAAVMLERPMPGLRLPHLRVPDTRRALGELAHGWRTQFHLPMVAVTGSNGKTTVKEMIASIFVQAVGEQACLATRGNLNNDIGLPLTLLRLRAQHQLAVVEIGMNHPGEIADLSKLAGAAIALVNNAQREHQEFMDSVEATALENGACIAALPADGVAVFPGDDPQHSPIWRALAGSRRRVEFGLTAAESGDGFALSTEPDALPGHFLMRIGAQRHAVQLAIEGRHSVRNALAAAACAHAAGVASPQIVAGLNQFRPVAGRLVIHLLEHGAALIDDSYNANPDSVLAAIEVLAARSSPRVLVLGDMGEVGDQGPVWHREVGVRASQAGIEHCLLLGEATRNTALGFGTSAEHHHEVEGLIARARELAAQGASILVKGSRFMRMERVVQALLGQRAAQGAH